MIDSMAYRYLEHMTDAFIEVTGNTLEEAFENAGISVVDTMIDINSVEEKTHKKIEIVAKDLNNLLYNWLEEIIILTITEGFAVKNFSLRLTKNEEYNLVGNIGGEVIDFKKHHFKLEIKSPTFHLMEIKQEKPVMMRFLLDL
jgi:SHS2 domain-containing protein